MTDQIEQRLKEIEERAKWRYADPVSAAASADDVPALCKALRHLREVIRIECYGVVLAQADKEIAAILSGEEGQ